LVQSLQSLKGLHISNHLSLSAENPAIQHNVLVEMMITTLSDTAFDKLQTTIDKTVTESTAYSRFQLNFSLLQLVMLSDEQYVEIHMKCATKNALLSKVELTDYLMWQEKHFCNVWKIYTRLR
jgi:hypothetical protein